MSTIDEGKKRGSNDLVYDKQMMMINSGNTTIGA
jgi:hypothetical protein